MKSTTLEQLISRWNEQRRATHRRTHNAAGKPSRERWHEIVRAHARRIKRGRIVKNNAAKTAVFLVELNQVNWMIKRNRELSGLPPLKFVFGNSGTAKNWDKNGNYQGLS